MTDTRNKTIGARIQARREYLSLQQSDLAQAANMSRPNVANIEAGRVAASTQALQAFAGRMGVSLEYFTDPGIEIPANPADEARAIMLSLSPEAQRYALAMLKGLLMDRQPENGEE